MGLDIYIWKEEVLELDSSKKETTIKKTEVYQDKGWAIGEFLIETFDLNNGQTATIDLDEACKAIAEEANTLSRTAIPEGYEESINDLLAVLIKGRLERRMGNNKYAEYSWALDW